MNIIDYCKLRGDISFREDPINYVDCVAFSHLVYINFDNYFNNKKSATIEELYKNLNVFYDSDKDRNTNFSLKNEIELLKEMANSKRFKELKIHNYLSIYHKDNAEQFAAMVIDLPSRISVVAYRGTDDSLAGWQEDFQLSYKDVSAQYDALKYLNHSSRIFRKYYVVGHSKGGNLALYSAVNCKKHVQRRITKIVSCDGPGLRYNSYPVKSYNQIKERFVKIVPEFDIVGLFFDDEKEDKIIVKSNSTLFGQHSGMTWQVDGNKFENVEKLDDKSERIKRAIKSFLESTPEVERKEFEEKIFDKMKSVDIESLNDIQANNISMLFKFSKALIDIANETKGTVSIFIKALIKEFSNTKKMLGGSNEEN